VNDYWQDLNPTQPQLYADNPTCNPNNDICTPTILQPWLNNKSYLFNRRTITEPSFPIDDTGGTVSITNQPGFWYRNTSNEVRNNVISYFQHPFNAGIPTPCLNVSYSNNLKLPSPRAPLHAYKTDAALYDYYLSLLTTHPRGLDNRVRNGIMDFDTKIDMIWENGENLDNGFIIEPDLYLIDRNDMTNPRTKRSQLRYLYYFTHDVANYYARYGNQSPDDNGNYNGPISDPDPDMLNLQLMHNFQTQGFINKYKAILKTAQIHTQTPMNSLSLGSVKLPLKDTKFTIYARDGMSRFNKAEWDVLRTATPTIRGQKYSTPDFYPYWVQWRNGEGGFAGIDRIMECRNEEIMLTNYRHTSDHLFSPYVTAGWNPDENYNKRPAQHLGLLKILNVMGAEFFYTGHFGNDGNQFRDFRCPKYGQYTDPSNNCYGIDYIFPIDEQCYDSNSQTSPNGIHRKDFVLANYIWQTAMPSYAQAIASRYQDVLLNGILLYGDAQLPLITQQSLSHYKPYNFANTISQNTSTANPDPYIVVRQLKNANTEKYIIATSLQITEPSSCTPFWSWKPEPAANDVANLSFSIKDNKGDIIGEDFSVGSRRQGSVYMYDKTDPNNILFYQLDGWHQWQHPQHWDSNFLLETELFDDANTPILTTDKNGGTNNDYSKAFTHVGYAGGGYYTYKIEPKIDQTPKEYHIFIRAKTYLAGAGGTVSINVSGGATLQTATTLSCGADWYWYKLPDTFLATVSKACEITLRPSKLSEIDKIYITEEANPRNWVNEIKDGIQGNFPTPVCP
jgi:hypothetical protein